MVRDLIRLRHHPEGTCSVTGDAHEISSSQKGTLLCEVFDTTSSRSGRNFSGHVGLEIGIDRQEKSPAVDPSARNTARPQESSTQICGIQAQRLRLGIAPFCHVETELLVTPFPGSSLHQNSIFPPTWMPRLVVALVITPAPNAPTAESGCPKLGWLKTSYESARS